MSVQFTVAIPTYNGANRFPEVLDKLRQQTGIDSLNWEIILVDNNSTDKTKQVFQEYQKTWDLDIPFRYVFEPQQGLAFARQCAFKAAQGEWVGFLDDDNLPYPNWLIAAYQFGQAHPKAGALGSQVHGLFEAPPSEDLKPLLPYLALVERGSKPLLYAPQNNLLPPGAGVVIRKQAWLESVPETLTLSGRINGKFISGEDLELLSYIQNKGWDIWYNPAMELDHKIPPWRLEREYLIQMFRGIGLSRYVTRTLKAKDWQRVLIYPLYMINDTRKLVMLLLRYRDRVQSDIVATCQLEILLNSLRSPFYLWMQGYFNKTIDRSKV
ncbi:MAG TPA: glycosyl transferase [Cyanobacteria bacterium UBA11691]|nr:glycosyl transferase [Cyanobacteria bacterium UBA11691]